MEDCFETLISSYLDSKVGIVEHFVSEELAQHLVKRLFELKEQNLLKAAGIGNAAKLTQNSAIRSDAIYWLDRGNNNEYENAFLDQVDAFVSYLNRSCYTGITGYEFHYTLYEKGSFYKKHIDQFQQNGSRAYSMVMYLNADWEQNDGGELRIYHQNNEQNISPLNVIGKFIRNITFLMCNFLLTQIMMILAVKY